MARAASGPIPATPAGSIPIKPRERRREKRQSLTVLGVLTAANEPDKPLEVAVSDVSLHGCSFRSPVPFRAGAAYTLRIGTGGLHLASTLRIISSRDRADGFFDVGAKFV